MELLDDKEPWLRGEGGDEDGDDRGESVYLE